MYCVYTLKSEKDGTYYTGLSKNVDRRVYEHNKNDTKSTKSKKPWVLVYVEKCESLKHAREREKFWKSGEGRDLRDKIIAGLAHR